MLFIPSCNAYSMAMPRATSPAKPHVAIVCRNTRALAISNDLASSSSDRFDHRIKQKLVLLRLRRKQRVLLKPRFDLEKDVNLQDGDKANNPGTHAGIKRTHELDCYAAMGFPGKGGPELP